MDQTTFKFEDDGLRRFIKSFESDHVVRIGIFGGSHKEAEKNKSGKGRKAGAKSSGMTNAEVGFLCEVGRPKMEERKAVPPRSWLRVPLLNHINDIVNDSKSAFEKQVNNGDSIKFLTQIGINAEKYIQFAFRDSGPGWPANAPSTIAGKGSASPNIDTGQLRRAVASMVV